MRILTAAEMAAVDRAAQRRAKIRSLDLMERAAEGVTALCDRMFPGSSRFTVVCGPGNNGGDGLAVARLLSRAGHRADVFLLSPPERLSGDARVNLARAAESGIAVERLDRAGAIARLAASLSDSDGAIDALFGTGLSRPLSGLPARAVGAMNASGRPIVAIDVPSGLSGDGGAVFGPAVRASATAAIAALKHCHVLDPACALCGEIAIVDIGIPDSLLETPGHRFAEIEFDAIAPLFAPRPARSHKNAFGHLLIVAGGRGKAGAAHLVARAALRSGVGLVTVATPASLEPRLSPALPEVMTLPLPEIDSSISAAAAEPVLDMLSRCDALAIGPGLGTGPGALALVEAIVARGARPAVFDADALNVLSKRPEALRRRKAPSVVTPHPGEAGRLLAVSAREIERDRLAAVRRLARETGAVALLKGRGTLTADRHGRAWHNPTGGPALAAAGSGDVLTGMIGAFLAQGFDPVDAAVAGAFVHGLAGEGTAADRGALASEIADRIPGILAGFQ